MIKELREKGYQLKYLLKAMGMAKSTYYFELSKTNVVAERNEELMVTVKEIFEQNKGRYGVRRVHRELLNRGCRVNHKRVQRLMHVMGLLGKRPKEKYHSYKGEIGKIADNVIDRDFSTTAPFQKWTTDVSQFSFSWGKCYISPILDMNTNEIISYDLSQSPNMEQIHRMVNRAFEKFPSVNGLIFHSDQGWQYQHAYFRNVLKEHGIIQSMSRKGNCYDNCIMETFFGRLKNEMYYGYEKEYETFDDFAEAVKEYIDYYNNERIQAKTKWMSPRKIQGSIHVLCLIHKSMCPGFWVHITPAKRVFELFIPSVQSKHSHHLLNSRLHASFLQYFHLFHAILQITVNPPVPPQILKTTVHQNIFSHHQVPPASLQKHHEFHNFHLHPQ
ncbi:MAG: IS3 family transposase [Lachnospiraceae bacterium]|nr:IS3 family transposase [Lachnospiraceae bacterium]